MGSGDDGTTTCIINGTRVKKSHPCIKLMGSLDESQSALGLALSLLPESEVELRGQIEALQAMLFRVGFALAGKPCIGESDLRLVERIVEACSSSAPRGFVLHGGHPASAALALARAVVRRLERELVEAVEAGLNIRSHSEILRLLNRMSDALFALEVQLNAKLGHTLKHVDCQR
uniref:Cob(I)yrinic acid a,c-diamide adenosyltransferase n=1 Tax=Fervidicoccus fontis TaxID=683846 RepID=A0A7J3ZIS2_9CREN